ncbi:MAG: hypothetical protein ACRDOI_46465 [Trebonia sp.]
MLTYVFGIIAAAGLLAALYYCAVTGVRNGDRAGDAKVTALLATGARPGEGRILVTVRNPSGTPVLAALEARAALLPAWLATPHDISVPRWTVRGKFRPQQYATVAVVPAGDAAELAVPAPARARRYVLTAAVGQEGGRLRVHRLRFGAVPHHQQDERGSQIMVG